MMMKKLCVLVSILIAALLTTTSVAFATDPVMEMDGIVSAAKGTSLKPSYSFLTDENTGINSGAGDVLSIVTGGYERLRVNENGKVGIGTTNPQQELHVNGNARISKANGTGNPVIYLGDDSSFLWGILNDDNTNKFSIGHNGESLDNKFVINSTGNIGIGTASPGSRLDVVSDVIGAGHGIKLTQSAEGTPVASSYVPIDFYVPTTGLTGQFLASANNYYNTGMNLPANSLAVLAESASGALTLGAVGTNGTIRFNTGGPAIANERMRISSSGNIGIGTSSPLEKLDVGGNVKCSGHLISGDGLIIKDSHGTENYISASTSGMNIGNYLQPVNFFTRLDTMKAMTIDTSAHVGIGTDQPLAALHVKDYTDTPTDQPTLLLETASHGKNNFQSFVTYYGKASGINFDSGYLYNTLGWIGYDDSDKSLCLGVKDQYNNPTCVSKIVLVNDGITLKGNTHVDGALTLVPIAHIDFPSLEAGIFASTDDPTSSTNTSIEVYAHDSIGNCNQLSSHRNPKSICPEAITSFDDPNIAMPVSIHHKNLYMGKGQVIDTAKMVAYIEKKMQTELGSEQGRLVFTYDLPTSECMTVLDAQVAAIQKEIKSKPWIKMDLKAGDPVPPNAIEMIDEVKETTRTLEVEEKVLNLDSMTVQMIKHPKQVKAKVKTGKAIKRLKPGWKFENGDLYRQPTIDDIDVDQVVAKMPKLPKWILDRVKKGKDDKVSTSNVIEQIKHSLQAKADQERGQEISSLR